MGRKKQESKPVVKKSTEKEEKVFLKIELKGGCVKVKGNGRQTELIQMFLSAFEDPRLKSTAAAALAYLDATGPMGLLGSLLSEPKE